MGSSKVRGFWELFFKNWGKVTEENKVPTAPTATYNSSVECPACAHFGKAWIQGSQLVFQTGIKSSDFFWSVFLPVPALPEVCCLWKMELALQHRAEPWGSWMQSWFRADYF